LLQQELLERIDAVLVHVVTQLSGLPRFCLAALFEVLHCVGQLTDLEGSQILLASDAVKADCEGHLRVYTVR